MMSEKYRPSNGSEGEWFHEKFCMQCIHTNPDPDKKPQCEIWCRALCYSATDKKYPSEWTYDEKNKPVCTAWVKWDWNNDGDPDDDDNPKKPKSVDPNQLLLFSEFDDLININKPIEVGAFGY